MRPGILRHLALDAGLASAILALAVGAAPAPAGAQVATGVFSKCAPATIVVAQGDTLTFFNADALSEGHSVTHAPESGPRRFDGPITPPGGISDVRGVADLPPGSYPFTCKTRSLMTGTLVVRSQER